MEQMLRFPASQRNTQGHTALTSQWGNPSAASREKFSDGFIEGDLDVSPRVPKMLLNTRLLEKATQRFDAGSGAKKSQALGDKTGAVLRWWIF